MSHPKGKLIAVGGAEDKGTDLEKGEIHRSNLNFFELGILRRIVEEIGGPSSRIEIITTASMIPTEVGNHYMDAFGKMSCTNVDLMHIRNRQDAARPDFIERIRRCDGIMFSGGNQLRLSSIFGGTEILRVMLDRYAEENFTIAGTSAGAMAMSNTMIYEGNAAQAHLKGEVKITTGLGLMQNVIIDSHFDKRGRFNRLAQAVAAYPGAIGIGLGEDTGVIVSQGTELVAIGAGSVVIIDGKFIDYNNIADIEFGQPISVENIVVHIMSSGDVYQLNTRKFIGSEIEIKVED